ncbi:UNVERIFIED_CONTAM: hypothetical protein GTU68_003478, partial [Idotea baltica]|nr:hypothetical protein [Idotea baltica]
VLATKNLNKRYGRVQAVNNLNLEVPRGSVFGILGPNGSGKTTTLGMSLSVIHPTSGQCLWFGEEVSPKTLKKIGAILEGPLFYPYLSGVNNLKVVAKIKDVPFNRIPAVLDTVGLSERGTSAFKTYSLGMKQRLAIGAALLNNPEVLILDEPTNGLDPQGIREIRMLIRQIAEGGTTILLASHLLDEVEKVCDHVAVLKRGNLIYNDRVDKMGGQAPTLELAAGEMQQLENVLRSWSEVQNISLAEGQLMVEFKEDPNPASVNQRLQEAGVILSHLALRKSRLEDQFLELVSQTDSPQ